MTQIKISIDCDGEYCDSCNYLNVDYSNREINCDVFNRRMKVFALTSTHAFPEDDIKRCPPCLAATVESE